MRYVPLDQVLNYIPRSIRDEEMNDARLKSYMLMGLRTINPDLDYRYKVALVEVENHRACLPEDLRKIEVITSFSHNINPYDLTDVQKCTCTDEEPTTSNCKITLNHAMFLASAAFQQTYLLSYIGQNVEMFCRDCPNIINRSCGESFSIDENNNILTSFEVGVLCVSYKAFVATADNKFMIPDNEKLKRALALFAEHQHLGDRVNLHEEGIFRVWQTKGIMAEMAMKAARGSLILSGTNADRISNVVKDSYLMKIGYATK